MPSAFADGLFFAFTKKEWRRIGQIGVYSAEAVSRGAKTGANADKPSRGEAPDVCRRSRRA